MQAVTQALQNTHETEEGGATSDAEPAFSARQKEVLDCALALAIEGGERALTTSAIATAANCSKESLYRWFGDREGLLSAIVTHQSMKVRGFDGDNLPDSAAAFKEALLQFGHDLCATLYSDTSLALNRMSIASAGSEGGTLGEVLLEKGKKRIETAGTTLLEAGARLGEIRCDDPQTAYGALYGLLIGDRHTRALLGDQEAIRAGRSHDEIAMRINQFMRLHQRKAA